MNQPYVMYKDETVVKTLMRNVYLWMTMALGITGLTAWITAHSDALLTLIFGHGVTPMFVLFGAELLLVIVLTAAINRISFTTATVMFIIYSLLNGVVMSSILLVYTQESVASTFLISAGTFACMAVLGTVTKRDLSTMGRILYMSLFGLIIASLVNIYMGSSRMSWLISLAGVAIFVGLTAYDAQKIKQMLESVGTEVNETTSKVALLGSLSLYLDFINLFLYLIRIFGKKR